MRRAIPYLLVLLMTLLALDAALISWRQAHDTSGVTLYDCSTNAVVEPSLVILSCADANSELTNLRWTHWGDATAYASGTAAWNDCTPTCVAGKWQSAPIDVYAYRIRNGHYTRLGSQNSALFAGGPFVTDPYPPAG
jgi:hypothetical protein